MKQLFKSLIAKIERRKYGKLLVQFFKFGIVGLSNTALSWIVTFAVIALLDAVLVNEDLTVLGITFPNAAANLGNLAGFFAGVCNSFFLNKRYVFKNKQETSETKAFAKTFICYGSTFLLSLFLMNIVLAHSPISDYVATMLRLLITIPLNFLANKLWAFKDRAKEDTP